jgi:hypothetical protein
VGLVPVLSAAQNQHCAGNSTWAKGDESFSHLVNDIPVVAGNGTGNGRGSGCTRLPATSRPTTSWGAPQSNSPSHSVHCLDPCGIGSIPDALCV